MPTSHIITGFCDEVSDDLEVQVKALHELGWSHIDLRTVNGKNISSLTDREFDQVQQLLAEHDIAISCFGSSIANWGRDVRTAAELDRAEMINSIGHMKKAGVRFIRIMSYRIDQPVELGSPLESLIIDSIRNIVRLAEDNGLVCLHENCETWGGQSHLHSLRLLEEVDSPALQLVFDTGNPVSMLQVTGEKPYSYQDSLEFFRAVREHVAYIHIKDARLIDNSVHYTFPAEGDGKIREILDLVSRHEMEVPLSIEPHVAVVYHDPSIQASFEQRWDNFIDYGRRLVTIAEEAGITLSGRSSH